MSRKEEAERFLGFCAPGFGWRAREVGAFELASALRGPSWPGARRVALDPLPGALADALAGAAEFDLPRSAWTGTGLLSASPATRVRGRDARGSLGHPSFRARVARVHLLGREAAPEAVPKSAW